MAIPCNSTSPHSNPGDAIYRVEIAGGGLTGLAAQPIAPFTASFTLDTTPPTVVTSRANGSSLTNGSVIDTVPLTLTFTLSEAPGFLGSRYGGFDPDRSGL